MAAVRIAVIADIHGNYQALRAVLDDARRAGVHRTAVLGDIVNGGPEPARCWQLVRDAGDWILRGNHERYVLAAAAGDARFRTESFGPARWTAERLGDDARAEIAALPTRCDLDASDAPPTLLCHASPRSDDDMILADTPDADVAPMLAGVSHDVVVRGHNHEAFERRLAGIRLIAVGSVGLPFATPPRAEYAILEARGRGWSVERRRVAYDVDATLAACRSSGYLAEAGPVARLFAAEIATGRRHLSPFMRGYDASAEHGSLTEAVDLFLLRRTP